MPQIRKKCPQSKTGACAVSEKPRHKPGLAGQVGVRLHGPDYCVTTLMERGLIKLLLHNSRQEFSYVYIPTPLGTDQEIAIAGVSLKRQMEEDDGLRAQFESLRSEVGEGLQRTVQ